MTTKTIQQYLERYSDLSPELDSIAALGPYAEAVVVPVCGEDAIVDGLLDSLVDAAEEREAAVLVVLVVNQDESTHLDHRASNRALLDRFASLGKVSSYLTLAVLDRTKGWEKCGVGTARKIGSDVALALHAKGLLSSPWIHTTDADARVAMDYFTLTPTSSTPWGLGPLPLGAMVHPYRHRLDGAMGEALRQYDAYLRYYSQGLAMAGSPFAFPTIGSTISFSAEAYAQVRGFPRKQAGEDFYFLHKVSKVAFIWEGGGEVSLVCRPSNRVPFGTGQSIAKIAALKQDGTPYTVCSPAVFEQLSGWFQAIDQLAEGKSWEDATSGLGRALLEGLEQMGADQEQTRIQQNRKTAPDRLRHWHTWFDGFRTLKLIHYLRDNGFPNEPLAESLADFGGGHDHRFQSPSGLFEGQPL
jgi:hypothetical protein